VPSGAEQPPDGIVRKVEIRRATLGDDVGAPPQRVPSPWNGGLTVR
jgi:hypothetical protein